VTVFISPMINCQNMTMITKIGFDNFTSSFELVMSFIISVGLVNMLFHHITYIFLLIYNLPFL